MIHISAPHFLCGGPFCDPTIFSSVPGTACGYFRIRVPRILRPFFGRSELRRSLITCELKQEEEGMEAGKGTESRTDNVVPPATDSVPPRLGHEPHDGNADPATGNTAATARIIPIAVAA